MKINSRKALTLLFSVLIFALPSRSQQVVGAITGTVTDPIQARRTRRNSESGEYRD